MYVPNLVSVRRQCRKKRVQTDKGTQHPYIVDNMQLKEENEQKDLEHFGVSRYDFNNVIYHFVGYSFFYNLSTSKGLH